nr:immunoglobulin heavy chain junction region [Mus musculus]
CARSGYPYAMDYW